MNAFPVIIFRLFQLGVGNGARDGGGSVFFTNRTRIRPGVRAVLDITARQLIACMGFPSIYDRAEPGAARAAARGICLLVGAETC